MVSTQRVTLDEDGNECIDTQIYTMILKDAHDAIQDSKSVVAMVRAALEFYKKGNPHVTEVFIRSDNAGKS